MFNAEQLQVIEGLLKGKANLTEIERGLLYQVQEMLVPEDEFLDDILNYFDDYNVVTVTKMPSMPIRKVYIESDIMTDNELSKLTNSLNEKISKSKFKLEGELVRSNQEINITELETILY